MKNYEEIDSAIVDNEQWYRILIRDTNIRDFVLNQQTSAKDIYVSVNKVGSCIDMHECSYVYLKLAFKQENYA